MIEVTCVHYMYRDANNYKAVITKRLVGVITDEQRQQIRDALEAGETFIPEQIGWEHAGRNQGTWTSFPNEDDDHAYHELDPLGEDITVEDSSTVPEETVDEWVAKMAAASAAGWDPVKYDPNHPATRGEF